MAAGASSLGRQLSIRAVLEQIRICHWLPPMGL